MNVSNLVRIHLRSVVLLFSVVGLLLSTRTLLGAEDACTYIAQEYEINTTWSGPIVCVTSNINVSNLNVLPGVQVVFAGNYTVRCLGPVRFLGTAAAPIVIRAASTNTAGWQGFLLDSIAASSEFEYCVFSGARNSAVRLRNTSASLRNCSFSNCFGTFGGALNINAPGAVFSLSNCTFFGNYATNDGGAIWCSVSPGKLVTVSCSFTGNVANPSSQARSTGGGAICVAGNALLHTSHFVSNTCRAFTVYAANGIYAQGGAVYANANVEIIGCEFLDNACVQTAEMNTPDTSYGRGGAFYAESGVTSFRNTIFAGNRLSAQRNQQLRGSALYLREGDCSMTNVTIVYNVGAPAIFNEAGDFALDSSVIYFNHDRVTELVGSATVNYSIVEGGYVGTSNINYAPVMDSRYRFLVGSPNIDTGDPSPAMNDSGTPSLGAVRCDAGHLGGPLSSLWNYPPFQPEPTLLRIEMGHIFTWIEETSTVPEYAVSVDGPWSVYSGLMITNAGRVSVIISPPEPRQFFRLRRN